MELGDLVRALRKTYQETGSWRRVAEAWKISKGMAYRIAMQGYDPKSPEIRLKLGLPLPSAQVIPVTGIVPDGAQAPEARRCKCGKWFIPNGTRKRCYDCLLPKALRENGKAMKRAK